MQHSQMYLGPLEIIKRILMVIGFMLFLVLATIMFTVAGNKEAARDIDNPQPELRVSAQFSE